MCKPVEGSHNTAMVPPVKRVKLGLVGSGFQTPVITIQVDGPVTVTTTFGVRHTIHLRVFDELFLARRVGSQSAATLIVRRDSKLFRALAVDDRVFIVDVTAPVTQSVDAAAVDTLMILDALP